MMYGKSLMSFQLTNPKIQILQIIQAYQGLSSQNPELTNKTLVWYVLKNQNIPK